MVYNIIKNDIDLVVRPNGRFAVIMTGDIPEKEIYYNSTLFMDVNDRDLVIYFHRFAFGDVPRRNITIAEIDNAPSYLLPVLIAQRFIDVFVVVPGVDFESITEGDFKNFMATCRKMV